MLNSLLRVEGITIDMEESAERRRRSWERLISKCEKMLAREMDEEAQRRRTAATGSIDRLIGNSLDIGICNRPRHTEIPNGTGDDLLRKYWISRRLSFNLMCLMHWRINY